MTPDIRTRICQEAFTWAGTPYHHLAAVKGVGADCARFPLAVAVAVGIMPPDYRPPVYAPQWHLHQGHELYYEHLDAVGCRIVAWEARQPGDILLFRFGRAASHAAILLPGEAVIHAVAGQGVVVQALQGDLLERRDRVYALPGVPA